MALSGYRYNADFLAQAGGAFDVQKQNMAVLELVIDQLPGMRGGQEVLTLALQEWTVPGREVGTAELPFLNGTVNYPTHISAYGDITVTFRDFPLSKSRAFLVQWFSLVYNETSGLMTPPSALKTTGYVILFQSDATAERVARLEGVFPSKLPEMAFNYANGEHLAMAINLKVDRLVWENTLFAPATAVTPIAAAA